MSFKTKFTMIVLSASLALYAIQPRKAGPDVDFTNETRARPDPATFSSFT